MKVSFGGFDQNYILMPAVWESHCLLLDDFVSGDGGIFPSVFLVLSEVLPEAETSSSVH